MYSQVTEWRLFGFW